MYGKKSGGQEGPLEAISVTRTPAQEEAAPPPYSLPGRSPGRLLSRDGLEQPFGVSDLSLGPWLAQSLAWGKCLWPLSAC